MEWWKWTLHSTEPFIITNQEFCARSFNKNDKPCVSWIDLIPRIERKNRVLGTGSYGTVYSVPEMEAVVKVIRVSTYQSNKIFQWHGYSVEDISEKKYITTVYSELGQSTSMRVYGIGTFNKRVYIFSEALTRYRGNMLSEHNLILRLLYVMGSLKNEYEHSGIMHCDVSRSNLMIRDKSTQITVSDHIGNSLVVEDNVVIIDWDMSVMHVSPDVLISDADSIHNSVNNKVVYMFPHQGSFVSVLEKCVLNYVLGSNSPFLAFAKTDKNFLDDLTWFMNVFFSGMGIRFGEDDLLYRHVFMPKLETRYSPLLNGIGVVDSYGWISYLDRKTRDTILYINDNPFHIGVFTTANMDKSVDHVKIKWKADEEEEIKINLESILWFHKADPPLSVRTDWKTFWDKRVFYPLSTLINKYSI
jgi:serine/threonine protein kinase